MSFRKRGEATKTRPAVRFLMLWIVAVLATAAAFVVHLSMRLETVRLGYEVGDARKEQRALIEQRRLLAIEAATLKQTTRIETIARGLLKMEVSSPERIVPIKQRGQRRRAAGRAR